MCHCSCRSTNFLLISLSLDHPLIPVVPTRPICPSSSFPHQTYSVVGQLHRLTLTTWNVINDTLFFCLSLCLFPPRCTSRLPPWPSLSACLPLCLWGCCTCPRSTSSSSTPSRTYPNENAASRWGGLQYVQWNMSVSYVTFPYYFPYLNWFHYVELHWTKKETRHHANSPHFHSMDFLMWMLDDKGNRDSCHHVGETLPEGRRPA